jgi:hypothetical protein
MVLSINSPCQCDGFVVLPQALTQALYGGLSFARRLRRQTFCGGTGLLEKSAQGELGLKEGMHPPISQGLARPDEFEHAQFPLVFHPHSRPHLRAERIIEHNEQHAAIEITSGWGFFCGLDGRYMEITLPGFKDKFDLPAERLDLADGFRLP